MPRDPRTAMELTEDELVEAIARVLSGDTPGVLIGIGDDAAVVEAGAGPTVLTTDLLVEDVHFEAGTISAHDLGSKAVTVNVSDIAAMAASPRFALVGLALGPNATPGWVMELYGGMREACEEYALSLVGGDLNRGDRTVIAITVIGEVAPGRARTRAGATPRAAIVVTGMLGAAAGGFLLSRASSATQRAGLEASWGRELLAAFTRPVARVGE
ncbi:MAG: thiamine-phosphate kinase, partial [Actinomycetota bacterium]